MSLNTTVPDNNSTESLTPIRTLLVANRGEIACRVMATAQRLGMRTVAIYSEADADALHVRLADTAICVGPALASESYLNIDAVIDAARQSGADAIHPGYGFLSENPDFVEACVDAGLLFVGPDANAMRSMGLKDAAKALMESAGVPVVPGYHGENQQADFLAEQAAEIGYPVLIKARAGGGGKGMRKVDGASEFLAALQAAQREAGASFGDSAVLIEKYIEQPRHIEVQVFGDRHGNTVHLFERDCSLQRRHQKVIEEAPAPAMTDAVRDAMTASAIRTAQSINYVGAGTVEFIVDASGPLRTDGFWFMEMNTRLQVEHPVTEAVTGYDLVEWQLMVAAGHPLPVQQADITLNGHAVEARLYAEDVDAGFLPATGTLKRFALGDPGRVDTGVVERDVVQPYYDPMLAKLIAHAPNRQQAFQQLQRALDTTVVLGTTTNRAFLARLCGHGDVLAGAVHTGLIEDGMPDNLLPANNATNNATNNVTSQASSELMPNLSFEYECNLALAAIACVQGNSILAPTMFKRLGTWQMWGEPVRSVALAVGQQVVDFTVHSSADSSSSANCNAVAQWTVKLDAFFAADSENAERVAQLDALANAGITVQLPKSGNLGDGLSARFNDQTLFAIALSEDEAIFTRVGQSEVRVELPQVALGDNTSGNTSQLIAPMPGRIIAVAVNQGDAVNRGDLLVTLEAMKMEHNLIAHADTTIDSVLVSEGDQVEQGARLVLFDASE